MTEGIARHALSVWNYMNDNGENTEDGNTRIFTGSLTGVFDALSISRTYYSPIWRLLEDGGWLARESRGGGGRASAVQLYSRPEISVLLLTEPPAGASLTLVQRIDRLESAIGGYDIGVTVSQLQAQIDALSSRFSDPIPVTQSQV